MSLTHAGSAPWPGKTHEWAASSVTFLAIAPGERRVSLTLVLHLEGNPGAVAHIHECKMFCEVLQGYTLRSM